MKGKESLGEALSSQTGSVIGESHDSSRRRYRRIEFFTGIALAGPGDSLFYSSEEGSKGQSGPASKKQVDPTKERHKRIRFFANAERISEQGGSLFYTPDVDLNELLSEE